MVVREVDLREFQIIASRSPIPVIVEICLKHPICERIGEHFDELSRRFNGKVAFIRIDVGKHPEILKIFKVTPPAYIAIDRGEILNVWINPSPYQLTMIVKEVSKIL